MPSAPDLGGVLFLESLAAPCPSPHLLELAQGSVVPSRVSTAEIGGEEGRKRRKASFTPQFSTGSLVPSFSGMGACPQALCPSDHPSVDTSVTRPCILLAAS
ncbi:unnamed protein product [Rangifer tarandus platyrhynchus]|uniref:Uncharacterized protein n=1 Tax=Rangifer tarandus platyrhynchus TaxID=3082113 RepID=A0ABN9A1W6_RANTA|nr:unnamed protein product [Rangifer tarandus platyrhynchus]